MIYLFWATCRPLIMRKVYYEWMDKADDPHDIELSIAVDNKEDLEYLSDFDRAQVVSNPDGGVVKPIFELTYKFKGNPGDIMIVPSDDFHPPDHWDTYLKETMENHRGVLKVNDGHMDDIISIPVLKYEAFLEMGRIIYHPAYNHMFCDKELHDTANELGICLSVDKSHPLFEHHHPHYRTRIADKHDEANGAGYQKGRRIYEDRRYMSLKDRMVP